MAAMRRLVNASHVELRAKAAARERQSGRLRTLAWHGFVGCLLAAAAAATVTMHVAAGVLRDFDRRSAELRQVTGLLIERQETTARRFSHGLHDELGQTLVGVKADVAGPRLDAADFDERKGDALKLVDDAIHNVRELSHLLHPTLLEHLGLAAALRSLPQSFGQRTGIDVDFQSDFEGRLAEETRTHLHRIV